MIKTTEAMAEAAMENLKNRGVTVSRETAWQAVDAALMVAPKQESTGMTRAEALKLATETTNANIKAATEEGTKGNGYKADSFRYPTVSERTQAILDLAGFLMGDERG